MKAKDMRAPRARTGRAPTGADKKHRDEDDERRDNGLVRWDDRK